MKTYIIQYFKDGVWVNYMDANGFNIEFLSLSAADQVACDLGAFHELMPSTYHEWRIKSSSGEVHNLS